METSERRRRGRRPADAQQRRAAVLAALQELEKFAIPFSMQDVADRAGISRATLYRDAGLRDLIAARGGGPKVRPVDARVAAQLDKEIEALKGERSSLKKDLRALRRELVEWKDRCAALERENKERMYAAQAAALGSDDTEKLRAESFAEGFAAGTRAASQRGVSRTAGASGLSVAAARLPRAAVIAARRTLARALHPDLFAQDPAASVLATEILKQLNSLIER